MNENANTNTSQAARQNKGIKAKLARQTAKGAAVDLDRESRERECESKREREVGGRGALSRRCEAA